MIQQETNTVAFGTVYPTPSPTGEIIPDGHGGALLSIHLSYGQMFNNKPIKDEEFIYRVTDQGQLAYKFQLPAYKGSRHDEMVLGEDDQGFATRGGTVISFSLTTGAELWRYDTEAPEIKIVMATDDGGIVLNTSKGQTLHVYKNAQKVEDMFHGPDTP